jgi:hypothetical protein
MINLRCMSIAQSHSEMHLRVIATTIVQFFIAYRVSSLLLRMNGITSKHSMLKNMNIMKELRMEIWIGLFQESLWLLWVQLIEEKKGRGLDTLLKSIQRYSSVLMSREWLDLMKQSMIGRDSLWMGFRIQIYSLWMVLIQVMRLWMISSMYVNSISKPQIQEQLLSIVKQD